jgi:hypothetical protein
MATKPCFRFIADLIGTTGNDPNLFSNRPISVERKTDRKNDLVSRAGSIELAPPFWLTLDEVQAMADIGQGTVEVEYNDIATHAATPFLL